MSSPKSWRPWAALAVASAIIGALAGAWVGRAKLASPSVALPALQAGTWLPGPREIRTPALIDSRGQPFTEAGFAGHASLLFFGFTHCPDVCPTTLALLAQVRQVTKAQNLSIYLVSVDPERDSPEVMARYLANFNPEFIGLTGTPPAMKDFARSVGAAAAKVHLPGGSYSMDHSATLYLLDDAGELRAVFTPPHDAAKLAADLETAVAAVRG